MVSADRDGLARVIRDAYAVDIIPADTLLSDEAWSGLVGSVEEWYPEADAALAYLAARPAVVDVEVRVRHALDSRGLYEWDGYCGVVGFEDLVTDILAALTPDVTR